MHKLYNSWKVMKRKCYNPKAKDYLGGHIKVCDDWINNYKSFYEWALPLWSNNMALTRINNNLDYSPINCCFISRSKIASNNGKVGANKTRGKKRSEEVTNKIKHTNLERYGVEYILQSKEIQQKIKNSNITKYGMSPAKLKSTKEKTVLNNQVKYGVDHPQQLEENRLKSKQRTIDNGQAYFYDGKTTDILAKEANVSRSCMCNRIKKYGFEVAISMEKRQTEIEFIIESILQKHNIDYLKEQSIDKYKPDFVIPDYNLIIEADGIYWHSDAINNNNSYHKQKKEVYQSLGYHSLFFRENEIHNQRPIVESVIANKLKMSTRIYARKCALEKSDKKIAKLFFLDNHLMGNGKGNTYTLKYQGIIVGAMQITNKSEYMEISRFCTKLQTQIIGGFSRLLKYAIDDLKPSKVITFIDKRYGAGDYLVDFGFKKETERISFKWVKDNLSVHRMKFPGNTGYEHGYNKLWDCGQAKYVKYL
jgi:very-short-patch-repair endonuclease